MVIKPACKPVTFWNSLSSDVLLSTPFPPLISPPFSPISRLYLVPPMVANCQKLPTVCCSQLNSWFFILKLKHLFASGASILLLFILSVGNKSFSPAQCSRTSGPPGVTRGTRGITPEKSWTMRLKSDRLVVCHYTLSSGTHSPPGKDGGYLVKWPTEKGHEIDVPEP